MDVAPPAASADGRGGRERSPRPPSAPPTPLPRPSPRPAPSPGPRALARSAGALRPHRPRASPPPRAQPRGLGGIRRLRGFASCVLAQRRVPPPVPGCPHLIAPEPRCRAADASPPPVSHPDTARAWWKDTKRSPRMTAEGHHAGYERTRSFAPRQSPRWLRRNSAGGGGETLERMEFPPRGTRRRRHRGNFPRRSRVVGRRCASRRRDRSERRSKIPPPGCPLNLGGGGVAARPAGAT